MKASADLSTYFDRGLRRSREAELPLPGAVCVGEDGLQAQFSLEIEGDVIRRVGFRVTTCVTSVAFAELLAEAVTDETVAQAIRLRPETLARAMGGVPTLKQSRAILPVQALHAAIFRSVKETR